MSVTCDKYSAGLVFRAVKSKELYYIKDDTMVVEGKKRRMEMFMVLLVFICSIFMTHYWNFIVKY